MNTATRLGAYGAGLALVFGGAFVAADAVVPQSTVSNWTKEAKGHDMGSTTGGHGGHGSSAIASRPALPSPESPAHRTATCSPRSPLPPRSTETGDAVVPHPRRSTATP